MAVLKSSVDKANTESRPTEVTRIVLYDKLIPGLQLLLKTLPATQAIAFNDWVDVETQAEPFRDIDYQQVSAIFVRSTTRVNKRLLKLIPKVKFIATATSGTDHLDIPLLVAQNIHWADAKGSNAQAVADYVSFALNGLLQQGVVLGDGLTVVLGHGHVGQRVVHTLKCMGTEPRWADPLVESLGGLALEPAVEGQSSLTWPKIEAWLGHTKLLCMHTPLTLTGPWATQGWLSEQRLAALPDGAVIIAAGRGETLVNDALLQHANRLNLVLDVWPGEPAIDLALLDKVKIATPHIAGHSRRGKVYGAWQTFISYCQFLGSEPKITKADFFTSVTESKNRPAKSLFSLKCVEGDLANQSNAMSALTEIFDLMVVDARLRVSLQNASLAGVAAQIAGFKHQRQVYEQHPELIWETSVGQIKSH